MEDRRFIYPSTHNPDGIPDGESVSSHSGAITIEPRLKFLRVHEENCTSPSKGHFVNHDRIFWFCAHPTDKTQPGEIKLGNPVDPGQRTKVTFTSVPTKDDFVLILPLMKENSAIVLGKTTTPGAYDIFSETGKTNSGEGLVTGDSTFNDATKIRGFIAPKNAIKPNDVYFYVENVVGATNIYLYRLDTKKTTKIDVKNLSDDFKDLKRLMHVTVSNTYITFTGAFGDKEEGLKFVFF